MDHLPRSTPAEQGVDPAALLALVDAVDSALYASKRGGRDRVTVWSPRLQGAA